MGVPFSQLAMTAGETDERMALRSDVKSYYQSAKTMKNVLPTPYGGFGMRGGLRHWAMRRRVWQHIDLDAADVDVSAALTSGTVALLVDQSPYSAVVFAASAVAQTLLTVDLGAVMALSAFDVSAYQITSGTVGVDLLKVETSEDGTTWTEWGRRDLGTSKRTRRFATAPRQARTCRYVRLAAAGAHGALSLGGVDAWIETAQKSVVRILRHQTAESGSYSLVLTDHNCDFYKDRAYLGSAPIWHVSSQLRQIKSAHSWDTAVLFHPDVAPIRLFRAGADDEWDGSPVDWSNMPTDTFGGGAPEAIMSVTRGWPCCGAFCQNRLIMGGLRSLPQTIVFSNFGEPFNLDMSGTLATAAFRLDLDGDENGIPMVRMVRSGPRLEVATQMGFFYATDAVVAKGQNFAFAMSERVGIQNTSRLIDGGDAGFFIEDGGAVIRKVTFDDVSVDKYSTQPASILSAHLISGAIDMAVRRTRDTVNANQIHILRSGGGWTVFTYLGEQDISGFVPFVTAGTVEELGMLDDFTIGVGVQRADDVIEIYDPAARLDASVVLPAATALTGLDHLNNRTDVVARQGAMAWRGLHVTGGALALPDAVVPGDVIEVGLSFDWEFEQHRLAGDAQRQIALNRMVNVSVVQLDVTATGPFELTVDDDEWRPVEPRSVPVILDPSEGERFFSGVVEQDGFCGGIDGRVKLRGSSPWPFICRAITRDATW